MEQSTRILHGDCLHVLPTLADNSADLIATDPPYFKVKNESWDRQWQSPQAFLEWLDKVLAEFHRILKANGSLYLFASPKMAARVEVLVGQRFNVLNRITWRKPPYSTKAEMFRKSDLRIFFPASEAIIFAEHDGADGYAKGESGYGAKCDELRGFVFEPLRKYLDDERQRAGWTIRQVAETYQEKTGSRTVTGMAGHWFGRVQWMLPTEENYHWLRELFAGDYLRREYDDLRREYDDLRRPFTVSAEVPYTDVWDFPTVQYYPGKHPCEKPLALMQHIISSSTRPGAVVLDPFMGSGATGKAAASLGRRFIGIDSNEAYCRRVAAQLTTPELFAV